MSTKAEDSMPASPVPDKSKCPNSMEKGLRQKNDKNLMGAARKNSKK